MVNDAGLVDNAYNIQWKSLAHVQAHVFTCVMLRQFSGSFYISGSSFEDEILDLLPFVVERVAVGDGGDEGDACTGVVG